MSGPHPLPGVDSTEHALAAYMSLPVPVAVVRHKDASYVRVNAAYARMLRRDVGDFAGRSVASLGLWDEDPAVQAQVFEKLGREGSVGELDAKLLDPDGEIIRVTFSAQMVELGGEVHILECLRGAEELERLRRGQLGSEAKFEGLFNGSTEGLSVHELDGQLREANPALCELLGVSPEALHGRAWSDLHTAPLRELALEMFQQARAGHPVDFEGRLAIAGGKGVPVQIRLRRIDILGAPVVIATCHDSRATEALQQQLLQAQKMEAVGRLVSGVSHDFNNILTVIRGLAFVLQDALPEDHEEQETIEELDRAAQRAAGLTRQLLVFSRRKNADSVNIELGQLVRELNRMLRRLVPASIDLSFDFGEQVPAINADPGRVEHLIALLAVRAKEHGLGNGSLEFRTETADRGGSPRACLTVRDLGGDVDPTLIAGFNADPLSRSEAARALNLEDVAETCATLHCELSLSRLEPHGLQLSVIFPATQNELRPEHEEATDSLELTGHETVLLAEDEASLRTLVAEGLRRHGYTVLTAEDPVDALSVATAHGAPIHLLITDLVMPRGTGAELAERLRDSHRALRVLFVSGYAEESFLDALPEGPGNAFIQKVFTQEALLLAVRRLLDQPNSAREGPSPS